MQTPAGAAGENKGGKAERRLRRILRGDEWEFLQVPASVRCAWRERESERERERERREGERETHT